MKQIKSVQSGNDYDVATSKSSDIYPAVWIELPVLIEYPDNKRKTFQFALNFLTLTKQDDLQSILNKTDDMEVLSDVFLQALSQRYEWFAIEDVSGLTLRNFSADDLSGVRIELTFTVGRECDFIDYFDTK